MKREVDINNLLSKEHLEKEELITLLSLEPNSKEVKILINESREYAKKYAENKGKIWGAIGLDYMPCKMNCNFCSLADKWNPKKDSIEFTDKAIFYLVEKFVKYNVDWLVVRTTEYYDFDRLIYIIQNIKEKFPGNYILTVNTGDAQTKKARELKNAGVDMVYHCLRLREGVDTKFSYENRLDTIKELKKSNLLISQYLEPIGPEHTNEEIADKIIEIVSLGTDVTGLMPRVTVPGTPKEKYGNLSEERLAQITSIMRVYGKEKIRDFIIHPAYDKCIQAGANSLVVDIGALPRDREFSVREWKGQSVNSTRDLLKRNNYLV